MSDAPTILTSYPGKIISFDPVKQFAVVEIQREQYTNSMYELWKKYAYPYLRDVPVHFPQGGGYQLTFPVTAGDNCMIHFCDRGISHWKYFAKSIIGVFKTGLPKQEFFRRHDVNDAVCIVGYNPLTKQIPAFNATSTELRNSSRTQRVTLIPGGTMEVVTEGNLHITAPTTVMDSNVTINGTLHVAGQITCDADVVATGVSLISHVHTSVTPGPPTSLSGPPKA